MQADEPSLVLDLDEKARQALRQAYSTIAHALPGPKIMLAILSDESRFFATGSHAAGRNGGEDLRRELRLRIFMKSLSQAPRFDIETLRRAALHSTPFCTEAPDAGCCVHRAGFRGHRADGRLRARPASALGAGDG